MGHPVYQYFFILRGMIYIKAQWVKTSVDQDNIENVFKIPIIDTCELSIFQD